MNERTLRSRVVIAVMAIVASAFVFVALPSNAAAQCLCDHFVVDVDSSVQCLVKICIPSNGGEICRSFGPGITVVEHPCGLPNSATIPTLCGRISPPTEGNCIVVPITNSCCLELCSIPTGSGCYRLQVRQVNVPCPCP